MRGAKRIIKKELARVFKDKRLIFTMYIMPAILMFAIYGLMGKLMSSMNNDITEHTDIVTVVNATEAFKQVVATTGYEKNASVTYVDQNEYASNKQQYENEILNGEKDLLVVFEPMFYGLTDLNGGTETQGESDDETE